MSHICLMMLGRLVCSRVYCVRLRSAGVGNSLSVMGETFTAVLNSCLFVFSIPVFCQKGVCRDFAIFVDGYISRRLGFNRGAL
ncbi:MAG: hypothetical protein ACJAW0_001498 [Zhongshania sp.]|jgi:hypothetical protein